MVSRAKLCRAENGSIASAVVVYCVIVIAAATVVVAQDTVVAQEVKVSVSATSESTQTFKEAQAFFRKGSFDRAIEKYNEALKSDAPSTQAYAGIVLCYLKQEKVREASDALEKGLQLKPSDTDLKELQGELFFRQGKIHEAESVFVQLVNSGHPPARACLGLARIYSAIAMYAREHTFLVRAHELDPDDQDIQKEWMMTISRADRIKFLESYLAQETSDDPDTRRELGTYLEFLKARQAGSRRPCRPVSDVTTAETELLALLEDPSHLRGVGLPVIINGQKSKLMLDTGAGGITINRKLAARAGVERMASVRIGGVGDKGDAEGYAAYADSIRIGNLEFHNCPVDVVDKRSVVEEEGLIGADVFQQFLIELDLPARKLRLSQLPPRPGETQVKPSLATDPDDEGTDSESEAKSDAAQGNATNREPTPRYFDRYVGPEVASYTRVYRFGHMLLVPTGINQVPGKLFLIDTGAWNNMITPDAAREVTKVHGDSDTTITGLSGKVNKVYGANSVVLEFGGLRQKNEDMVAFNLSNISRDVGTEVSGTLGFAMLNLLKIKLDYRDAMVKFEYTPSPWQR
ncbi:MAG TPA: aspartyl protease family protein [Terriglobales bacterium]|nr:aspartyl protease family protein [Terriglobales bacterium]